MSLGLRGRLFLASVGLIMVVGLTSGGILEASLNDWLTERLKTEMLSHARLGASLLADAQATDPIADQMGAAIDARVTLIDGQGRVLGDSSLSPEQIDVLDSHENRPEVRSAMGGNPHLVERWSTTLNREMLYVAAPLHGSGVVRIARPRSEIDEVVHAVRALLGVAAVFGLVVAVFMSGLASHFMSRTLRSLVDEVRSVVVRQGGGPPVVSDEINWIAGSVKDMAEELDLLVRSAATDRDRFGAVLEGMTEAVFALNKHGDIELVNRAATELFDLVRDESGLRLAEAVQIPALEDLIAQAQRGRLASGELKVGKGAEKQTLLAHVTPQRSGGGVVVVMHDVTQLRRLERMRRDFVANVSHELRTPISVIQANAETLLAGAIRDDPDRALKFTEAVLRNASRLSRLISDLLDISRLESGGSSLDMDDVEVLPAVERTLDAVRSAADEQGTQLVCEVASDTRVFANPDAFEQILLNLVENAVKYSGETGTVWLKASTRANLVEILVEDDGPGIPPKHRERIFERFYRVDRGRSREMGGTGLGLSIVKHLVQTMGGTVGIQPNEPTGCRFRVVLNAANSERAST